MEEGRAEGQILKPTGPTVLAVLDGHKVGDRWTCVQPLEPPLVLDLVIRAAREDWLGSAYTRAQREVCLSEERHCVASPGT